MRTKIWKLFEIIVIAFHLKGIWGWSENEHYLLPIIGTYLIFVLFSPHAQFLNKFFSTQKCVNRNKIDFAPIQRKWQQSRFCDKSAWIVTKKIVSTFNMWRNVSTWQILLHISPHDMIFLFIYHVETYLQLNICHVETLLHMTICHMEKISPHDKFFLHNHRLWWLWQISGMPFLN